ncbi:hypothetical protein V8B97DRAFT_1873291, partial [Scleroderma yunnanense]
IAHSQAHSEMVDSKAKNGIDILQKGISLLFNRPKPIQQLKDHLARAETTMNSKIQKLKMRIKEICTELAAMVKKYDAAIHQNKKSTESGPPGSHCGCKIIGVLVEIYLFVSFFLHI